MDNAGGSVPARQVIDRVTRYLSGNMVQLGASYPLSQACTALVDAGQAAAAKLVNADADEVLLNGSTTLNVYVMAQALASTLEPGDHIVVSDLDHEANRGAWLRLASRGIEISSWPVRETGELDFADLEPLLGPKTRWVMATHCANVVGGISPVRQWADALHARAIRLAVDGVAFAPHRRVDVRALDCDMYFCSLYKVYGPHVGLCFARRELLEGFAGQNHAFITNAYLTYKFTPGNVNHELVSALPGIVEYLEGLTPAGTLESSFDAIARHESQLIAPLISFLADRSDTRIIGPATADPQARVPTVAFVVDGMSPAEVVSGLEEHKIAARCGDFYAKRAIETFGLAERGGVCRVSLVHYNSSAEVERLLAALHAVLG